MCSLYPDEIKRLEATLVSLRTELADVKEALRETGTAMRSFRIFVTSKEQAHSEGIKLYDEVSDRARAVLAKLEGK